MDVGHERDHREGLLMPSRELVKVLLRFSTRGGGIGRSISSPGPSRLGLFLRPVSCADGLWWAGSCRGWVGLSQPRSGNLPGDCAQICKITEAARTACGLLRDRPRETGAMYVLGLPH